MISRPRDAGTTPAGPPSPRCLPRDCATKALRPADARTNRSTGRVPAPRSTSAANSQLATASRSPTHWLQETLTTPPDPAQSCSAQASLTHSVICVVDRWVMSRPAAVPCVRRSTTSLLSSLRAGQTVPPVPRRLAARVDSRDYCTPAAGRREQHCQPGHAALDQVCTLTLSAR